MFSSTQAVFGVREKYIPSTTDGTHNMFSMGATESATCGINRKSSSIHRTVEARARHVLFLSLFLSFVFIQYQPCLRRDICGVCLWRICGCATRTEVVASAISVCVCTSPESVPIDRTQRASSRKRTEPSTKLLAATARNYPL